MAQIRAAAMEVCQVGGQVGRIVVIKFAVKIPRSHRSLEMRFSV
jgi:hypothetical protein